jgi:integrase/recombinase XerD
LGVKFERVPLPTAQNLTPDEMQRVWEAIAQRGQTRRHDLALVQLLSHNLRAGEVAASNVGSFDGRLVSLTETKNKQPRLVPIAQAGQQAIQDYLDWRRQQGEHLTPDSPLILSHHQGWEGERLSYHGIYFAVERIGALAGLPDLHPHQFRHTGATELLRMGLDPAHARRLTGHTDERSFRRYTLAAEQEAAIAAFYRAQGGGKSDPQVYAQNLNQEQRQLLMAMAAVTGMQPQGQAAFESGEISFAQLWQQNVSDLEAMLNEVKGMPEKFDIPLTDEEIQESNPQLAIRQPSAQLEAKVKLWLRVENNSQFGRGKTKVRREIENRILSRYQMHKPMKSGWDYELSIPYEDEADLERTIAELYWEMDFTADLDQCFIEAEIREEATGRV